MDIPAYFGYFALGWLFSTFMGGLIGEVWRGQFFFGCVLGILLGPLGWLFVSSLPDKRRKCPSCGGVVPVSVSKCRHCGDHL